MNQILATKPTKQKSKRSSTVNIKTVVIFFAISIIIFGICLVSTGSYAVYKELSSNKNKNNTTQEEPNQNAEEAEIDISLEMEEEVGTEAKLIVTGQETISFVTYKWDDEEETRIDIDGLMGECTVEIPSGKHTITIVAVDANNNTKTKKVAVTGVTKPKLEVKREGAGFSIKANDSIGIEKIEIILNGKGYLIRGEGKQEVSQTVNILEDGENKLEVKVYNVENVTETFSATWQK